MDRELIAMLGDLGLTATEAELYLALLSHAAEGPLSAYGVAKLVGRDPANTTKALATLEKRGAVRIAAQKPRRYLPVSAEAFTEELLVRLQARRRQAVERLERVGQAEADVAERPLADRAQAVERARLLLAGAQTIVLADADAPWVADLAPQFQAAAERGVAVLVRTSAATALAGVRIWVDPAAEVTAETTPGSWFQLVVDGREELTAVGIPGGGDHLLAGTWHREPVRAFLTHRALAAVLVQAALHAQLAAGAEPAQAARQMLDLQSLVLRRVEGRSRWQPLGLPAAALAEVPPPADQPSPKEEEPLQFVFRRPRG